MSQRQNSDAANDEVAGHDVSRRIESVERCGRTRVCRVEADYGLRADAQSAKA